MTSLVAPTISRSLVSLADCCTEIGQRVDDPAASGRERFVGLEHLEPGEVSIRDWGSTDDVTSSMKLFEAGDVLVARRNVYLRRAARADFDGVCSGDAIVLRPKDAPCLPELIPFVLNTDHFWEYVSSQADGTMSKRITVERLMRYEFALPPLEEQLRIAGALWALERALQTQAQTRRTANVVATALMERLLAQFAATHQSVPVEGLLREPPRNGLSPATNADGKGLKTVSVSAVSDGVFDPSECIKYAQIDPAITRPFLVREGDVFVIRGNGNRNLTGKAGLARASCDDLFYPDLLIRLRFDEKRILPEFAVAQWNLPSVHRRLNTRAKSTSGIWKVNGQDVRAHCLIAPAISEQVRALGHLNDLQHANFASTDRQRRLLQLKSIVLAGGLGE